MLTCIQWRTQGKEKNIHCELKHLMKMSETLNASEIDLMITGPNPLTEDFEFKIGVKNKLGSIVLVFLKLVGRGVQKNSMRLVCGIVTAATF